MYCQKKSGKNECRLSDLYFLDEIVNVTDVSKMLNHSPLCCYIFSYTRIVTKQKFGETCIKFETYGVRLEGQWKVRTNHSDTINIVTLHNIQVVPTVVEARECGGDQQAEEKAKVQHMEQGRGPLHPSQESSMYDVLHSKLGEIHGTRATMARLGDQMASIKEWMTSVEKQMLSIETDLASWRPYRPDP